MSRFRRFSGASGLTALLLIALATLNAGSRPVEAGPKPSPGLVGDWNGFFLDMATGETGVVRWEVVSQDHRRFKAIVMVGSLTLPCEGTLSASNKLDQVCKGPAGMLNAHGDLLDFRDGSFFLTFEEAMLKMPGSENGFEWCIHLLKSFDTENPASLLGAHTGEAMGADGTDLGPVRVQVRIQDGSSFMGVAEILGMSLPFLGTIGEPPSNPVHALVLTPEVEVLVNGSLTDNGLALMFEATFPDGSMLRGTTLLQREESG